MIFLEKNLEEIIFTSDKKKLSERGLFISGKLKRQFRIGNYGISDLIEIQRPYYHNAWGQKCKGCITIYELKKDIIDMSSFSQAIGYLKGIKSFLEKREKQNLFNFKIVLIGKKVDLKSNFCYLPSIFNTDINDSILEEDTKINIEFYTYKYDIDGLYFEECDFYNLTNKGF